MAVRTRTDSQKRTRYDVEFMQRGRRVLERCPPGTTLAQARERETQLRREAYSADTLGHAPEVLLSEVIQGWLSVRPHKWHQNCVNKANQWIPYLKGRKVSEALEVARLATGAWTAGHAGTPPNARSNSPASSAPLAVATINRRLAILKAALTWHGREDLSRKIKLRREMPKIAWATRGQVLALSVAARSMGFARCRVAIMLLAYSGLRVSELLSAEVNMRAGTMSVIGKGEKPRVVPLPSRLLPFLRAWRSVSGEPYSYDTFHKQFTAARKAAKLPAKITPHVLRHSFATWLVNAGENLKVVSQLLGHADVQITARHYAHLYDKTLKDAVRRLR